MSARSVFDTVAQSDFERNPKMLTKLTVRNFKRFGEIEVELGNSVVFVGPNNSGKTSAMQALALWDIGIKRWNQKLAGRKSAPE